MRDGHYFLSRTGVTLELIINNLQNNQAMITKDKVIEIFCIIDEFDKGG